DSSRGQVAREPTAPSGGPLSSRESVPFVVHGEPRVGDVLFDCYRVEKLIGRGGMGTVWLVLHLDLNASRALKLIIAQAECDREVPARFKREAQAMAKLVHPNAVTVHRAKIGTTGAFIEMEFLRGQSLDKRLKPGVPAPLDWIEFLLGQLCDVLQEAHDL